MMPVVDIHTIGAGGGSLAYAEAGGLRVGPESAGADPGPACYGRGGTQPTVTDANLVLGRVDERSFAGGSMTLDVDAARAAVARLGDELGLETVELAEGICDVANAKMAQAIRTLTVEKGIEPRDFALVAFGGAGPMHAVFLARELGIAEVLVPRFPGAFSAWGMLETEVRKDTSRAYFAPLAEVDGDELAALLAEHEAEGLAGLADEGIAPSARRVRACARPPLQRPGVHADHRAGRRATSRAVRASRRRSRAASTRRTRSASATPTPVLRSRRSRCARPRSASSDARSRRRWRTARRRPEPARRPVVFDRTAHDAAAIHRDDLGHGAVVDGPAVISEQTATTVVPPGARATVDAIGTLVIEAGP